MNEKSASEQIDDIIKASDDWRGQLLASLRAIILEADSAVIEEVKWKKPSQPEGVAVWSLNGIICLANILKNAVRLTFPKGVLIKDPQNQFNTRLDSRTVRAIDYYKDAPVNADALKDLIIEAIVANKTGRLNKD